MPELPTGSLPVRVHAPTEQRYAPSAELDLLGTRQILQVINEADRTVAGAVGAVLDPLAVVVEDAVAALQRGNRVHYVGAGTSGRLGVLDAAELPPTFNAPRSWFCAHIAGGPGALLAAVEDAEDDTAGGADELARCARTGDVVVGIAASGRTPYVLGALRAAGELGCRTALIAADPHASAAAWVDVFIGVDTGPEVITGSTRMKAATAQKLLLNAFSSAVMVRLGRVFSNFMIDMVPTNAKLRGRMLNILVEATGHDEEDCRRTLDAAGGDLRAALVALLAGREVAAARGALAGHGNRVRDAVAALTD
ncbi:N-acetylmuramic acid 6-phosphate etherase [Catellatospora vulcania]|uniref:N-acetylmuramic acid 6-phosphate etherase n=1 Tax=Catellatospora vulcania TaxID=1460450 RepID=UPI0012D4550A|nr:N-acetylmuramic acid 6-phosphate etherase [Catellatospora vulcania]